MFLGFLLHILNEIYKQIIAGIYKVPNTIVAKNAAKNK